MTRPCGYCGLTFPYGPCDEPDNCPNGPRGTMTSNQEDTNMTDITPDTITIKGVEYVPTTAQPQRPHGDYVIVRSDRAGVFAGHLVEHDRATQHVVLTDVRRLWRWIGASLSEVAVKGAIEPANCKYSVPVAEQTIGTVIEVIPVTEDAMVSIKAVDEWTR